MDLLFPPSLRGTDNLRLYLSEAILPKMLPGRLAPAMPSPGSKSHMNHLSTRPDPHRKLRTVHILKHERWEAQVLQYHIDHIPAEPLDVDDMDCDTGERLTVAAYPLFNIPETHHARPVEISKVVQWVDEQALQTVQRALHLALPEKTEDWYWFPETKGQDPDWQLFRTCTWGSGSPRQCSLLFSVQTPWVLSPHDLRLFTKARSIAQCPRWEGVECPVYTSRERLWAKIWDECAHRDCRWFVTTSYEGWTFGVFSAGWTTAFVTKPIPFDSQDPTILQSLVFWIASSMGFDGGFVPSHVFERPEVDPVNVPLPNCGPLEDLADSESEWYPSSMGTNDYKSFIESLVFQDTEPSLRGGLARNTRTETSAWTPPVPIPGSFPRKRLARTDRRRRNAERRVRERIIEMQRTNEKEKHREVLQWIQEVPESEDPPPSIARPRSPGQCPLPEDDDDEDDTSVYLGEAIYAVAVSNVSFEFETAQ